MYLLISVFHVLIFLPTVCWNDNMVYIDIVCIVTSKFLNTIKQQKIRVGNISNPWRPYLKYIFSTIQCNLGIWMYTNTYASFQGNLYVDYVCQFSNFRILTWYLGTCIGITLWPSITFIVQQHLYKSCSEWENVAIHIYRNYHV